MTEDQQLRRIKRLLVINLLGVLHVLAALCLIAWVLIDNSLLGSKWMSWAIGYFVTAGGALSWPREIEK